MAYIESCKFSTKDGENSVYSNRKFRNTWNYYGSKLFYFIRIRTTGNLIFVFRVINYVSLLCHMLWNCKDVYYKFLIKY